MNDNTYDISRLGDAVREARIRNNLTHEALAEQLDISPTHIRHIESGHRKPSVEILFKISAILHMSLDCLVNITDDNFEKSQLISEINLMMNECEVRDLKAVHAALNQLTSQM